VLSPGLGATCADGPAVAKGFAKVPGVGETAGAGADCMTPAPSAPSPRELFQRDGLPSGDAGGAIDAADWKPAAGKVPLE
jgi:hypothetical protein